MEPGLAAIGRFVDSIANRNAVARPRFTSSHPDIFRIFRIERNRADRLDMLFIEHGAVPRSAVIGFPNAATGRANEKRDFTRGLARTRDGRDAPAHCRGTYVARAKARDCR